MLEAHNTCLLMDRNNILKNAKVRVEECANVENFLLNYSENIRIGKIPLLSKDMAFLRPERSIWDLYK